MEFRDFSEEEVVALVLANPGLKQPQLLELMYPGDLGVAPDPTGRHPEGGNPIKRPHQQLERHLKNARVKGLIDYTPKGMSGGWRKR